MFPRGNTCVLCFVDQCSILTDPVLFCDVSAKTFKSLFDMKVDYRFQPTLNSPPQQLPIFSEEY